MPEKLLSWIDRNLLTLFAALFLLRSGFLLVNGLGLIGDESYYWDWSRHPDWCYFSKPPMVAWLIGGSTWLIGDSEFAVRLPTVVLGSIFLWYFHATAQAYYGRRAAAFALVLILATPSNAIANLVMSIDPPLYCFWMMSLFYLRRALFDQQTSAWFLAGCASAAALLSKQVAVALPLMLLLFILLDPRRYVWLKREFLFYLLPIMLAMIPIIVWNQQHDWVMFGHSKGHFINQSAKTVVGGLKYTGEFFLYQMLLNSPLIFGLTLILSIKNVLGFKVLSAEKQFLVLMGPAILLAVVLLSFLQKVQGNWPLQFYFTALILLSGDWLAGHWKKTLKFGLIIGYGLVILTYLLPALLQIFPIKNPKLDPMKRFKYWHELAENVQIERQRVLPVPENSFLLTLGHRNMASELAFYLPDHPKAYRFETSGAVGSQYEIWPGPLEFIGKNGFVVSAGAEIPEQIKSAFKQFKFLSLLRNPKNVNLPYYLFLGESLQNWPSSAQNSVFEE